MASEESNYSEGKNRSNILVINLILSPFYSKHKIILFSRSRNHMNTTELYTSLCYLICWLCQGLVQPKLLLDVFDVTVMKTIKYVTERYTSTGRMNANETAGEWIHERVNTYALLTSTYELNQSSRVLLKGKVACTN